MKFCIVIGHKNTAQGAISPCAKWSEYKFNTKLAEEISCLLGVAGHEGFIISKDDLNELQLANLVEAQNPKCSIELHCNAFNKTVCGSEVLYIEDKDNIALANIAQSKICCALKRDDRGNRGIKKLTSASRGYKNLIFITVPAVIIEPFFIDSPKDFELGLNNMESLALAISDSMIEYGGIK